MSIVTRAASLEISRELKRRLAGVANWDCVQSPCTALRLHVGTQEAFYVHLSIDENSCLRIASSMSMVGCARSLFATDLFSWAADWILDRARREMLPILNDSLRADDRAELMLWKARSLQMGLVDQATDELEWTLELTRHCREKANRLLPPPSALLMTCFLVAVESAIVDDTSRRTLDDGLSDALDAASPDVRAAVDAEEMVQHLRTLARQLSLDQPNGHRWFTSRGRFDTLLLAAGLM